MSSSRAEALRKRASHALWQTCVFHGVIIISLNSGNALCLKDVRCGEMSSNLFHLKAGKNRKKKTRVTQEGSSGPGRGSVRRRSWRKPAPREVLGHPRGWLGLRTRKRPEKELAEASSARARKRSEGGQTDLTEWLLHSTVMVFRQRDRRSNIPDWFEDLELPPFSDGPWFGPLDSDFQEHDSYNFRPLRRYM